MPDGYGYFESSDEDADVLAEALLQGPLRFSWTDGVVTYDACLVPSSGIRSFKAYSA